MESQSNLKISTLLLIIGILFILSDFGFAVKEFQGHALHGDIIPLVLPDTTNAPILSDPFGLKALSSDVYHPNINRYFCASSLHLYMRKMPLFLQNFINPIHSLYLSSSLFKIGIYLSFIFFMFRVITWNQNQLKSKWLALISLLPFLQINGVNSCFDFVGSSIVYAFFYGFPFVIFSFFMFPFLKAYLKEEIALNNKTHRYLIHFLLGFCLLFSSAIIPPTFLIIIGIYGMIRMRDSYKIKRIIWTKKDSLFAALFCVAMYSLILGSFNSESANPIPIIERYTRLLTGFYEYFFKRPALLVSWLLSLILFKMLGQKTENIWQGKFKTILQLGIIFSIIYIFLLPLGGYRNYRPYILRFDTLLPVSIFSWGIVSLLFYHAMSLKNSKIQRTAIVLFILSSIYFSVTEFNTSTATNTCERDILHRIASCPIDQEIIYLKDEECPVIDWLIVKDPNYYKNHSKLLQYWNISDHKVLLSFEKAPW